MRLCSPSLLVSVAALASLGSNVAHAQSAQPGFDMQRFEPTQLIGGFVTTYTARQLPRGRVGFDLWANYAYTPFAGAVVGPDGELQRAAYYDQLVAAHARFAVAPTPWMQVAVGMPVVQWVHYGPLTPRVDQGFNTRDSTVAWGDVVGDISFTPLNEDRGAGLSIGAQVSGPTGSPDVPLGNRVVTFTPRVAVSASPGKAAVAGFFGYRFKPGFGVLNDRVALDDQLIYGLGAGVHVKAQEVRLNAEIEGRTTIGKGLAAVPKDGLTAQLHTALEANANVRYAHPSGFVFVAGGGAGLTSAPGSPLARAFLSFGFEPTMEADFDHDGIINRLDACVRVPEDFDGYQDVDGCPEDDNDQDGILDLDDRCPDDPEDRDGYRDEDGCPDDDNDKDRVPDRKDACPDVPEDRDGFEDADGCPDKDNDEDGFLDPDDRCPNDPEDFDGISDDDGCPDREGDRDGDRVIDPYDPCPDDPEDFDLFHDDDGCPEPDNDLDGLLDPADDCPNDPETFNGFEDEDGCPDADLATLRTDRIEISQRVLFYTDEARLRVESYPVLDAVVATIRNNPDITKLRVEGHTDSDGVDAYNVRLAVARANTVRDYLIDAGIEATRLVAKGYGEGCPVSTNRTDEGKEQNRRVEFIVLEQGGAELPPLERDCPEP